MQGLSLCALLALTGAVAACKYRGNTYVNDETWVEKDAFKMRCIIESNGSWRTQVVACLTSDQIEVPINGRRSVGNHDWVCTQEADGNISLKVEMGKNADCPNGHRQGETWLENSFKFVCVEGGMPKLLACVHENNEIEPNSIREMPNGQRLECKAHANGTVTLMNLGKKVDANCVDSEGYSHAYGETWTQKEKFKMICKERGQVDFAGCIGPNGSLLSINSIQTINGVQYHCERNGNGLKFYTDYIGQ